MTTVTTTEAQAMLPRLLASVAQGEEVLITDGGFPVARLSLPAIHQLAPSAPAQAIASAANMDDEDDRPWRGVFAIESPGDLYPGQRLQLPVEPLSPAQEPADIIWDRVNSSDD
jgi:antitoxin (DNA-binding transcriptional repressor) of toxin-antitoxin stability system